MGTLDSIPSLPKDDISNSGDVVHPSIAGQGAQQSKWTGPYPNTGILPQHVVSNPLSTGASLETKQSKPTSSVMSFHRLNRSDTKQHISVQFYHLQHSNIFPCSWYSIHTCLIIYGKRCKKINAFNIAGSQSKTSRGSDLVTELLNRGNKLREAMILSTLKERSPLDDSTDIHLPQVSSSDPVFSKARRYVYGTLYLSLDVHI